MPEETRLRNQKIHAWVQQGILKAFDTKRIRMGLSRDGALEHALQGFIQSQQLIVEDNTHDNRS